MVIFPLDPTCMLSLRVSESGSEPLSQGSLMAMSKSRALPHPLLLNAIWNHSALGQPDCTLLVGIGALVVKALS